MLVRAMGVAMTGVVPMLVLIFVVVVAVVALVGGP